MATNITPKRENGENKKGTQGTAEMQIQKMRFHRLPSREECTDGPVFRLRASYSPAFPARSFRVSGAWGFRSLYGCGAAGAFHPSSSRPSVVVG